MVCLKRNNSGDREARVKAAEIWLPAQSTVQILILPPASNLLSSKGRSRAVEHGVISMKPKQESCLVVLHQLPNTLAHAD